MPISKEVIVLKGNREAQQIEGTLTAITPKPGQHIVLNSAGLYALWAGAADGEQDEVILLIERADLGARVSDAYVASDRFIAFIPLPGDECNILVTSGETIVVGDKYIIKNGTGKVIKTTGTPEMEPWKAIEASGGALGADTLLAARRM